MMLRADIEYIKVKKLEREEILLQNIHFVQESNSVFTILGKNGEGKSTFIKSLTNLLPRNTFNIRGTVYFNDLDLLDCTKDEILNIRQNKIKYVFQDPVHSFDHLKKFKYYFDHTGSDVSRIDELLSFFMLPEYKILCNLHPYEVSVGMSQRINFILSLLYNPDYLILDEPTSSVDTGTANLILQRILKFKEEENNAVLIVTQDVLFAQKVSDRIAFLADRTLSKFFDPDKFLSQNISGSFDSFVKSVNELVLR